MDKLRKKKTKKIAAGKSLCWCTDVNVYVVYNLSHAKTERTDMDVPKFDGLPNDSNVGGGNHKSRLSMESRTCQTMGLTLVGWLWLQIRPSRKMIWEISWLKVC